MAWWKTMLLAGVVVAGYFLAGRYFELVAFVAVMLWAVEFLRSRRAGEEAGNQVSVLPLASLLGVDRERPHLRSVRLRWQGLPVQLGATEVEAGVRRLALYDMGSPVFRKTPFCFVIRPRQAPVREEQFVENSRVPGVDFEYALRPVKIVAPLEAAANLPELLEELLHGADGAERIDGWGEGEITVQKLFFNGRALHTQLLLGPGAGAEEAGRLLDRHVRFLQLLMEMVERVNFKAPL